MPVLTSAARLWWLYGPPCAGKSATAWQLYAHLLPGRPRAYFDIDQVGMCYPEREDDPDRYALKARAAGALVRRLAAAGAGTVVVSGVVDQASMQAVIEETPGIAVTFCRVRVNRDQLTPRLQARYDPQAVQRALDEARAADEQAGDHITVDTSADPPEDVAAKALQLLEGASPTATPPRVAPDVPTGQTPAPQPASPEGSASADRVVAVLVCGATGVGKSTAGFGLFMALLAAGRPSSYVDLEQLSFRRDLAVTTDAPAGEVDGHRLTAACAADVWQQHLGAGSRTLVLTGHVETAADVDRYRAALGEVPLLVCRLRAGRGALQARIQERTRGQGPLLAGDGLIGMGTAQVQECLERSLAQQQHADEAEVADVVIDTDARDIDSVTEELIAMTNLQRQGTGTR